MSSKKQAEQVRMMRERTTRLDRAGDYWTEEEKEMLVQKFMAGEGITAIALALQRSEPAVYQMGTSKNSPFGFWTDLLPQQCVLKSPQYTKYSGLSKTFVGTKSLAQNTKK